MVCSQEHASAAGRRARPVPVAWIVCGLVVLAAGGCRSHLNQQLLERELRLQEDQIYHLQDVLEEKCARLEHAVRENSSLKRQLGISGGDAPPTIDLSQPGPPPGSSQPTPAPPAGVPPPPTLEGVPPLPDEPMVPGAGQPRGGEPPPFKDESGPSFGPAAAAAPRRISDPTAQPIDPVPMVDGLAAATSIRRLSYEESVSGESAITHVVLNREKTSAVDGDGDGVAEALTVVFEPRDPTIRPASFPRPSRGCPAAAQRPLFSKKLSRSATSAVRRGLAGCISCSAGRGRRRATRPPRCTCG